MNIDTNFIGTTLKKYETKITWRQTTNYAAALRDNSPFYLDDERKGGLVAHPMFPVAEKK